MTGWVEKLAACGFFLLAAMLPWLGTPGCVHPYDDRAKRDLEVGHAESAGWRVDVDDGLGAVRGLGPRQLSIWAQAPTLGIHIARMDQSPGDWTIAIDNCLRDAELTAAADGKPITPRLVLGSLRTKKQWILPLTSEHDIALSLRAPDADDVEPWRFAVMSDVQEAIDRVGDIYQRMNGDPSIRFVLSAGDLTDHGTHEEMMLFQEKLELLDVPLFSAPGNHDIASSETIFREDFGRGNFHFTFRGVAFTLLDSASASIDPVVYDWLDGWLSQAREGVHVVASHIPPIDPVGGRNAAFGSRNEASKLMAKMAAGHVDLALYGHIHSYYAYANAGIPAYISGGGGAHPERFDGIGRHYLTVDVAASGVIETGVVRIDAD
jgi:predicted phosphodiesterase